MRNSVLLRLAAGSFTAVALAACGGGGGGDSSTDASAGLPDGKLTSDGTFTYVLRADPGSLDRAKNGQSVLQEVLSYAYDTLVAQGTDNEIVPQLATEWKATPQRLTLTIREGVTCSDGSAVTPSVIAKGFKAFQGPKAQVPVFGGQSEWTVKADDAARTVAFDFEQPVGFPLAALTDVPIVCGKGLEDRKLLRNGTSGSGPYVLTKAVSNDRYTFERRKGYTWGPDGASTDEPGLPAKVVLRVVGEAATATNLLLAGEVDVMSAGPSDAKRVEAAGLGLLRQLAFNPQLMYNHAKGHSTADPKVRRALTMAADREAAAKVGGGEIGKSMVGALTDPCRADDQAAASAIPAYDVAAAEALLDEAGWVKGADGQRAKDGKRMVIRSLAGSSASPEWRAAAELISKGWRAIGIDVKSRTLTDNGLTSALTAGDWDVFSMVSVGQPTPALLVSSLSGPAFPDGPNLLSMRNAEYERLAAQALKTTPDSAACKVWGQAEAELYKQADVIPVLESDRLIAHAKNVTFAANASGPVPTSIRMAED
ncbi:MAG: ABC transporter substrate-binding protein [Patulibacter sp.]|nr:ABC transporter substrate-binding protein [Patulibacter sp.]